MLILAILVAIKGWMSILGQQNPSLTGAVMYGCIFGLPQIIAFSSVTDKPVDEQKLLSVTFLAGFFIFAYYKVGYVNWSQPIGPGGDSHFEVPLLFAVEIIALFIALAPFRKR
jgi:hypothetical protein